MVVRKQPRARPKPRYRLGYHLGDEVFRPMAKEQEQELWKKYKAGDRKALDAILLSHMRWIWVLAGRFEQLGETSNRGTSREDLVGLAVLEAYRSADMFNAGTGFRFSTYLYWRVYWGCWTRYMKTDGSMLKVPTVDWNTPERKEGIQAAERCSSVEDLIELGIEPWDHPGDADRVAKRKMIRRFILRSLRPLSNRDRKVLFRFIGFFNGLKDDESRIQSLYRISPPKLVSILETAWAYLYAAMAKPLDFGRAIDLDD